ncbi:MAG: hypothetical protein ACYCU7_16980 [Acidimicrobiales bacterium]
MAIKIIGRALGWDEARLLKEVRSFLGEPLADLRDLDTLQGNRVLDKLEATPGYLAAGPPLTDVRGMVPLCRFCGRPKRSAPFGSNCRCPFEP